MQNTSELLRNKLLGMNLLKDNKYTPKNVVLVTIEDVEEILREVQPYTFKKLDEMEARIATERTEATEQTVGHIYSIANDLANVDPKAVGSVSTAPYMANALAIYSEYLKGDDFERIDWRALNLPTLNRLAQSKPKEKEES